MPSKINKYLIAYAIYKRRKERHRSLYVRPIFEKRRFFGEQNLVRELSDDPFYHHKYFRMMKTSFDDILSKVESRISHKTNHALPITAKQRLAVTLRYLAGGSSQISLAYNYRISPSALSSILPEVMLAICGTMETHLKIPNTKQWKEIANDFEDIWNFPHACGAVDGKHIRMQCPANSGSNNYNYKSFFSIVLMAVVDAKYRFTLIDVNSCGSKSDGGVFQNSDFGQKLATGTLGFPPPDEVKKDLKIPYFLLGDGGFPLKSYLMRPYPGDYLQTKERIFNYRLSRARLVSENAFGILAARWRIFHTTINAEEWMCKLITKTCVILHNFLIDQKDLSELTVDGDANDNVIPGSWRDQDGNSTCLLNLGQQGSNNYTTDAWACRESLKEYFSSENGSVPWQSKHVEKI